MLVIDRLKDIHYKLLHNTETKEDLQKIFDDNIGYNLYMYISALKDLFLLEKILSYNFDVNTCDNITKKTLLHQSVFDFSGILTQFLLQKGANPNCIDAYGATPLYLAVYYNMKESLRLLLQYKADINLSVRDKDTPYQLGLMLGIDLHEMKFSLELQKDKNSFIV